MNSRDRQRNGRLQNQARAHAAQKAWKHVPVAERAETCRRMAAWCVERSDALASELTRQMGRPIAQSPGEIRRGLHERARVLRGELPVLQTEDRQREHVLLAARLLTLVGPGRHRRHRAKGGSSESTSRERWPSSRSLPTR